MRQRLNALAVTGALLLQNNLPVNITGVTGYELLTQAGPVTLNGAHTITMGINPILNGVQFGSAGADMGLSDWPSEPPEPTPRTHAAHL